MGTMSKSLASVGGFVAADRSLVDVVAHSARALIFSAALPPAGAAAALTALQIIRVRTAAAGAALGQRAVSPRRPAASRVRHHEQRHSRDPDSRRRPGEDDRVRRTAPQRRRVGVPRNPTNGAEPPEPRTRPRDGNARPHQSRPGAASHRRGCSVCRHPSCLAIGTGPLSGSLFGGTIASQESALRRAAARLTSAPA
jgi:hypothetical protein